MYVLFSLVTIQMSHFTAVVRVVKSALLVTVKVVITHVLGTIAGSNLQLASSTGTFHSLVPMLAYAAVHNHNVTCPVCQSTDNTPVLEIDLTSSVGTS